MQKLLFFFQVDHELVLLTIYRLEFLNVQQELSTYFKPPPSTIRSVLRGLYTDVTNDNITFLLSANSPQILQN
ncbi:hypothetical protein HPB48_010828 [Haemaphysalis longicornis]|uniref:Uncharacterized protein n=1 Tax=Haemaphysalis longicornis TaxID=44386 RepID=A0A9J6F6T7_HAELO|nr:hypothetical protein HPB48_010828 [Haemaphysalis longicornis]